MSVRHGVGISIIDRDNAAHISLTTPRTDFSFAGTPRWIFSRTSQASKGDRSPSFRWRLRICRGAPPRALRGLIFRTLGDGIDIFFLESVRSIASAALKGVDCDSDPSENSSLRIFQARELKFHEKCDSGRPKNGISRLR